MMRIEPALRAGELETLCAFLDYHRATFLAKVAGLDREQLGRRLAPSELTLAGLAKHLALVEDSWFQERFSGLDLAEPWASAPFDLDRDWDFHSAPADEPDQLIELYEAACARSRRVVAAATSLDAESAVPDRDTGEPYSLRWILVHMIEETARHNGHADLLREAIDGVTGE